jgi:hypothetical protein
VKETIPDVRVRLNIWDVGGQATLRPYWQNYYERTDALLWVVDSADVDRLHVCKSELHRILEDEKLAGATLLILANKQDLPGAVSAAEIKKARSRHVYWIAMHTLYETAARSVFAPAGTGLEGVRDQALENFGLQRHVWLRPADRLRMVAVRHSGQNSARVTLIIGFGAHSIADYHDTLNPSKRRVYIMTLQSVPHYQVTVNFCCQSQMNYKRLQSGFCLPNAV